MSTAQITPSLSLLRSRLASLRRKRAAIRYAVGTCRLATVILLALTLLFLIDWSFEPAIPIRVLLLLVVGCGTLLAAVRAVKPYWTQAESLTDVALRVERDQRIDSDLVAALQFDTAVTPVGSPELRAAVVEYVHESTSTLPVEASFDWHNLGRRTLLALMIAAALVCGAIAFPAIASAFGQRVFTLADTYYPTETNIAAWTINGCDVLNSAEPIRVPQGEPLTIEVTTSGIAVDSGRALLRTPDGESGAVIPLRPGGSSESTLTGELSATAESVIVTLVVGDAHAPERRVEIIPRPTVRLMITPRAPEYAREQSTEKPTGDLQLSVLEGSRVDIALEAVNKPLASATLTIDDRSVPFRKATGDRWELPLDKTGLNAISEPVRFEIQVTDVDGLTLEQPLAGFIGIKPDRPPRVSGRFNYDRYLPGANPVLDLFASDDYGLSNVTAEVQKMTDSEGGQPAVFQIPLAAGEFVGNRSPTTVKEQHRLSLPDLGVQVGDLLKVTLIATDNRGRETISEPSTLEVVDRSRINADLTDADRRSAEEFDRIIQQQLGIED